MGVGNHGELKCNLIKAHGTRVERWSVFLWFLIQGPMFYPRVLGQPGEI